MSRPAAPLQGMAYALAGFAVFSLHDALIKALGAGYSVFQIIFFATLFSFVPITVTMLADRRVDTFRPNNPGLVLLRSGLMVGSMVSAFYAFSQLPLTEVYTLLFTFPLLVTALSVPLLGEVVRAQRWAAVGIGLIGVLIVLRPGMSALTLGHLAALTAAVCSALATILVRKIGNSERSAVLILYPMLLGALAMGAMQPLVYRPPELVHLGMMALVGVMSFAAQHLIIQAYRAAPPAVVSPIQYSQIVWATLLGAVLFGERPDGWVALGAGIIIASGLFVVWRESRANVSTRSPVLRAANPRPDAGPSPAPKGPALEPDR
ncbi:membrane protein, putative (plasmid) [Ruegeria pomeroyi DSS-3]|uniref:Membrane protein, putative n=2 Tax=Ruegeria pomeroyi TaxID=89184 RepID=Q5LKN2_RUEPO|nr:DMT family transporter [Ruegeria pomeroyi]AAV97481.1 membrane protein, putative [Ruegeria pomeroyi DSS-3]